MNNALASKVKNKLNFKGSLRTYRFCDNVWTFVMNGVDFRESCADVCSVDRLRIVACDGKAGAGEG
jgi:transcription initiation factor TFIIA small subunit